MSDVYSKAKRSTIMSRVKSHGNKSTELRLVQIFRRNGIIGWRRNSNVYGAPDFVFTAVRVAVFVDGCFWHGCPAHATKPATNKAFWEQKLKRNRSRDRLVVKTLRISGWRVLRIWQHELARKRERRCVRRIRRALSQAVAQSPLNLLR
jgi:DNA mismatch endonuclease, patch repair protein